MFLEFHYVSRSSIKLLHFMSRWAELVTDKINGFWRIKVDVMLKWVVDLPVLYFGRQKIHFFVFLGCFWASIKQPNNHIGWATSMPFAWISTTNPRTNRWNFHKNISRIGGFENLSFFWVAHFWKKISKKKNWKSVKVYWLTRMGQNFDQVKPDNTFLAYRYLKFVK